MKNSVVVDRISYQDLLASPLSVADKSLAQYHSALNRFIAVHGKTLNDDIGSELMGGFDGAIQQFVIHQYAGDANAARSAVSCLRKWRMCYCVIQRTQDLPLGFIEALVETIKRDGRSTSQLSKDIGYASHFIVDLIGGRQKSVSKTALQRLEIVMRIPEGTLTLRAPYYDIRRSYKFCSKERFPIELQGNTRSMQKKRTMIRRQLPDEFLNLPLDEQDYLLRLAIQSTLFNDNLRSYESRQAQNSKLTYRLKGILPSTLQEEFNSLIQMKVTMGAMDRFRRNLRWSSGTCSRWSGEMRAFLGFCLLSNIGEDERMHGPGLKMSDLTLGLIISPELVNKYLSFRRSRTNGMNSTTSESFLTSAISMLRAGTGWVAGHSSISEQLPIFVQQEIVKNGDWAAQCAKQHRYLTELKESLDFETSRDSFKPIMPMIETGKPLDIVQQGIQRQYEELSAIEHLTNVTPVQKAIMWRNHLLINLISWLPLRAKHWHMMSYVASHQSLYYVQNGGQLRYVNGMDLGLYLEAKDFKNVKNRSIFGPKGDRDVRLLLKDARGLQNVEPLLKIYMEKYRPLLCAGDGPVFPDVSGDPLDTIGINRIIKGWTRRYLSQYGSMQYGLRLKGVAPFGPHAFRHLVASHVIINTGSIELAANILLDSTQMIEKHYGMFSPEHRLLNTMNQIDVSIS